MHIVDELDKGHIYMLWQENKTNNEDNLRWKTTVGGRLPLVEDNLRGRRPLGEDDFQWKTTFGGKQPTLEDNLWWKTAFGGRQPSFEDDLRWRMTFGGG